MMFYKQNFILMDSGLESLGSFANDKDSKTENFEKTSRVFKNEEFAKLKQAAADGSVSSILALSGFGLYDGIEQDVLLVGKLSSDTDIAKIQKRNRDLYEDGFVLGDFINRLRDHVSLSPKGKLSLAADALRFESENSLDQNRKGHFLSLSNIVASMDANEASVSFLIGSQAAARAEIALAEEALQGELIQEQEAAELLEEGLGELTGVRAVLGTARGRVLQAKAAEEEQKQELRGRLEAELQRIVGEGQEATPEQVEQIERTREVKEARVTLTEARVATLKARERVTRQEREQKQKQKHY